MLKQIVFLAISAGCARTLLIAGDTAKQEPPDTLAWLKFVASELRELRREVLDDRLERQEVRVRALEFQLRQSRTERQDGEEVQRAQNQEVLQLEQQLADPALSPEDRTQLESIRAEAASREQTDRGLLAQKEAQLTEKLRREQQRLEALRAVARSLSTPAAGSQN